MVTNVEKILRTAIEYGASDLYISTGSHPAIRINGNLVTIKEHELIDEVVFNEYLSFFAKIEQVEEFKKTNDLDFSVQIAGLGRFRINAFLQQKGPSLVLRPIPSKVKSISALNLPQSLKNITQCESGLVLVTGPTGSGKSTTLASMIDEMNTNESLHIITIEDPIEFVHENKLSMIEQREVKTHTASFTTALRAALREDPDVILVGEMRDLETISLAITAAETGHLVLATLHTSGVANTIDRMIDVFPQGQQTQIRSQLAMSLRAVVWQKLLPKTDNQGRVAALEILFNTTAIANLIRKGATHQIYSMMETGAADGMQTMTTALKNLADSHLISADEANKHIEQIQKD